MKLFIAINGKDKFDVLARLQHALDNDAEFVEDSCFVEHNIGAVNDYCLDYHWSDEEGDPLLVNLYYNKNLERMCNGCQITRQNNERYYRVR